MKFDEFVTGTIDISKKLLEKRKQLSPLAMVHVPPSDKEPKGRIVIMGELDKSMFSKDALARVILPNVFKSIDADMYAFVSETWFARCPDWVNSPETHHIFRQSMPPSLADWPDSMRKEGVMIYCESKSGESSDKFYELVRAGSDIDLIAIMNEGEVVQNRWAGLLK